MRGEVIIIRTVFKYITAFVTIFSISILSYSGIISTRFPDTFYVKNGDSLNLGNNISTFEDYHKTENVSVIKDLVKPETNTMQLRYKGIIPIKQVNLEYIEEIMLVPCGTAFGVKMRTDGVVVVGIGEVEGACGIVCPADNAGMKVGDIITSINGQKVLNNEEVASIINQSDGNELLVNIRRKNLEYELTLKPEKSTYDGSYKGGFWVRDSSAGIGTITFYNPATGVFGGLGHPICDVETGDILPLMNGEVVDVQITGIHKGLNGIPGELRGVFAKSSPTGRLMLNSESGVFGYLNNSPTNTAAVPLGLRQEITRGEATIYCTLDSGEPKEYSIYIDSVDISGSNPTKNMVIRITDPRLLETTGGIVQGMSGSPIIQGGKIIGAVTHVFVNDPTKGYGIFAENMIKTSSNMVFDRAS